MIALEVKNLGKTYRIYQSPSHRLKEIILRRPFHTLFQALHDINFTVPHGETFGIIGENGAGKSTLLKILAKTLKPTSGTLTVNGRIAALLELGAGFNPELSGEENIYLNAYLMGLSKGEIDEKKQAIIDFSELGEFIKRPVKTYSSGMYVRLAFAIATTVDPDVLIVDEALSVGDQHFQKKCIDRMMDFRRAGKTIVFCSHSLYHIHELCRESLWIKDGAMRVLGKTGSVISEYQNYVREKDSPKITHAVASESEGPVKIQEFSVEDCEGRKTDFVRTFQTLCLRMKIRSFGAPVRGALGFAVMRNDEEVSFATSTHFDGYEPITFDGDREITVVFPIFNLLNGIYYFRAAILDDTSLHTYDTASSPPITVLSDRKELGIVFMEHEWKL